MLVLVVAALLASLAARSVRAVQGRALDRWLASGLLVRSESTASWGIVGAVVLWLVTSVLVVVVLHGGPPGT